MRAVFVVCLTFAVQAGTGLTTEPTSGVVVRGAQKVWFDGNSTRTESYQHGRLVGFYVTGDRGCWFAYPDMGRVLTNTVHKPCWRPFQETTRWFFSQTTNHVRVGEEEFLGLPCWRYDWVETNLPPGAVAPVDGEVYSREVQLLFLANPAFPLMMRTGSGGTWDTNQDVREVELDVHIRTGLFEVPKGFKGTKQFQVPKKAFELVLRQTRSSAKHGWSGVTTTRFASDGDVIRETRTIVSVDKKGERTTGPTETVRRFDEAVESPFNYPMGFPMWHGVRRIGTDDVIGFRADVLDQPSLDRRYWVVDHPEFGAFSAKWTMGGERPETNEVVRVWVGE